jgi:hypothetical protein
MLSLHDALLGLVAPALVGVVIYWIFWRWNSGAATGVALSLGFAIGYCGVHGPPKMPPAEALEWLVLFAIAISLLIVIDQFVWQRNWIGLCCQLTVVAVAYALIVWLIARNGWPIAETIGWIVGSCGAAGVLLVGLTNACKHNPPISLTISLPALTIFAAAVLGMSGSQVYGLQAATMPAVLVPLAIVSIWRGATLFTPPSLPVFVLLYGAMLLCGFLYINLTVANGLLLSVAPLGLLGGALPAIRKLSNWQRALIPALVTIIPGAIAFGLALHRFLIDMSDNLAF